MNMTQTIIDEVNAIFAAMCMPTINVKLDDFVIEQGKLLGKDFVPKRAHDTDAGADILTPFDVTVPAHGKVTIETGVHVQTPPHCAAMLKSKSRLNIFHDIVGEGVIDEGFTNQIVVKLYNHGDEDYHFEAGDKIIQLVIEPVLYPTYVQAEEISGGERGNNGYGSTGR